MSEVSIAVPKVSYVYWNDWWDWTSLWEIKRTNLGVARFCSTKTWQGRQGNGGYICSHELNLEYRDTDRPTDVISLEYKPELDISFDEEELAENPELAEMMGEFDSYIGELFISVDKAHEQAEDYGHSFEREMGFLAVHGFLHINGYDHYTPEEEAEMFGLQEEILTAYGLTRQ